MQQQTTSPATTNPNLPHPSPACIKVDCLHYVVAASIMEACIVDGSMTGSGPQHSRLLTGVLSQESNILAVFPLASNYSGAQICDVCSPCIRSWRRKWLKCFLCSKHRQNLERIECSPYGAILILRKSAADGHIAHKMKSLFSNLEVQ